MRDKHIFEPLEKEKAMEFSRSLQAAMCEGCDKLDGVENLYDGRLCRECVEAHNLKEYYDDYSASTSAPLVGPYLCSECDKEEYFQENDFICWRCRGGK